MAGYLALREEEEKEKTMLLDWVKRRLKEKSTHKGIVLLLAAAGITINPELVPEIIATVAYILGTFGIVTSEKK